MILKCKYLFLSTIVFLFSCSKKTYLPNLPSSTFIRELVFSQHNLSEIKWTVKCRFAEVNENENMVKCNNVDIKIFKNNTLSSTMKSDYGYADLKHRTFYLERNVVLNSQIQNVNIFTQKINFDYKKYIVFSDAKSTIYKDNVIIETEGFEARSDLTNIKIKKHTTKIKKI